MGCSARLNAERNSIKTKPLYEFLLESLVNKG